VTTYSFVTRWHVAAPIDSVFDAILRVERWPQWWRGVEEVAELERGGADRVGSLWRYTWKSQLPYRLRFLMRLTRVEPPVALEGSALGELAGEGLWRLFREDSGTLVRYEWNVVTTNPWMNALAPLARPVFAWNHDVVMRWGGEGLARLLAES
jgi:uncharacterized protein YndB with AHSA1/START domain